MTNQSASGRRTALLLGLLVGWLALAALGQLAFLAHWPLYVCWRQVPYEAAAAVGLVRLGVYAGLAWGVARRHPGGWAGAVAELLRTVLLFLSLLVRDPFTWGLYPAAWAQGLLSALLPLVVGLNTVLASGWELGTHVEEHLFLAGRLCVAGGLIGALSLRRSLDPFRIAPRDHVRVLCRSGLLWSGAVALAELAALGWALRGGPGRPS